MMKKIYTLSLLITFVITGLSAQDNYKVIVNSANSISSISQAELANLFLKKITKFSNGTIAVPVDQIESSPVRSAFSTAVLKKSVAAVKSYWQQQLFSGAGVPPEEKKSDDDVIAFVKANPGAIGYVSSGSGTAVVKVLSVE